MKVQKGDYLAGFLLGSEFYLDFYHSSMDTENTDNSTINSTTALSTEPEFLLFLQHGWADDNCAMLSLGRSLTTAQASIIAPRLDYVQTWLRIAPLIDTVEKIATEEIARYPDSPIRIVGHSMGGLIWLEVLNRHPEWWSRVEALVLVASPVGGADLGRIIDPLRLGIGIARDLGVNRRAIAEKIAATIPTLVIAGNFDGGSDGTVPIESTRFANARFMQLQGLSHAVLRNHPLVATTIRQFWFNAGECQMIEYDSIVRRLQAVPGITDGHWRDSCKARPIMQLNTGGTILTWRNLVGIDHVYVSSSQTQFLYAGFVGWNHQKYLYQALEEIRAMYAIP